MKEGAPAVKGSKKAKEAQTALIAKAEQALPVVVYLTRNEVHDQRSDCCTLCSEQLNILLEHKHDAKAPPSSIHSLVSQVERRVTSLHLQVLPSFLSLPLTCALRLFLALWDFGGSKLDPLAAGVAELEAGGKSLLAWGDVPVKRTEEIEAVIKCDPVQLSELEEALEVDRQGAVVPEHFAVVRIADIAGGKFIMVRYTAGKPFSQFLYRFFGHEMPAELEKNFAKHHFKICSELPADAVPSSRGSGLTAYEHTPPPALGCKRVISHETY
ncbi:hypothetical protein JCM10213v2_008968 [Rhodosporidiobolus nylandii]